MTPDELEDALRALGWSKWELARRLRTERQKVGRWAHGTTPVPDPVADWLTLLVRMQSALPPPFVPDARKERKEP